MTRIKIPERALHGFAILFSFPNEVRHKLVDLIVARPVGMSIKTLVDTLPSDLEGKKDELAFATTILNSVFAAREITELSIDDFIPEFIEALENAKAKIDNVPEFSELLRKLLSQEKNRLLNEKFNNLINEGERVIVEARIVTDVRPMVDSDDDNSIIGLAIIHQLRLSFSENNQPKSLYFLLNGTDLDALEKVIHRAKNKELNFKNTFSSDSQVFFEEK